VRVGCGFTLTHFRLVFFRVYIRAHRRSTQRTTQSHLPYHGHPRPFRSTRLTAVHKRSQLDLARLRLARVPHGGAELRRLEGLQRAVRLRDTNVVGDVGVRPRLGRRLRELRWRSLGEHVARGGLVGAAVEAWLG
jgi:hypothetical protein